MPLSKQELLVCDNCGRSTDEEVADCYEYRIGHARKCFLALIAGFWGKGCGFYSICPTEREYYMEEAKERNVK